jgi:Zn-dependent membrane protease YugP
MIWNIDYLLFMLPAMLIGLWAQFKLKSAYGKYSQVGLNSGVTGAEA